MPGLNPPKRGRPIVRALFVGAAFAVAIAGAYACYHFLYPKPIDDSTLLNGYAIEYAKSARLAGEYRDTDGDLIADPPPGGSFLDPPELVFSDVTGDDPDLRAEQWSAFLKHLGAATGKTVRYLKPPGEPEPDPGAAKRKSTVLLKDQIALLKGDKLHVAAFTTGQVQYAVNVGGFVPLFAPADRTGNFGYEMEVIVPNDSPARTVADLKGKTVGFVTMSSNSGAKAPLVIFRDKFGLEPFADYKVQITGRHETSMEMVLNKKIDAACIANDLLHGERATGVLKDNPDGVRSIYKSETFPAVCFGVPHNLLPDLRRKIETAFASFQFSGNAVGENRYRGQRTKFVPVEYKRDWAFVRDIDDRLAKMTEPK